MLSQEPVIVFRNHGIQLPINLVRLSFGTGGTYDTNSSKVEECRVGPKPIFSLKI